MFYFIIVIRFVRHNIKVSGRLVGFVAVVEIGQM